MKKHFILIVFTLLILITGCSKNEVINEDKIVPESKINIPNTDSTSVTEENIEKSKDGIIEIKERMFVTQINEIFLNLETYKGKQIKLEGFMYVSEHEGKIYNYVIRKSPGCCGNDGVAGFEFMWDGEMPKENQWLEVVGVLDSITEEDGIEYPVLRLNKLEIKQQRGNDFVSN